MEHAWIAFKDDDVDAVLTSDAFNVRPAGNIVPEAMRGTALAPVFERLVRMNDGERHSALRRRVEERLSRIDLDQVRTIVQHAASQVPAQDVAGLTVATVIGLRDPLAALPWIRDFANAVAAGATQEQIARGSAAVEPLLSALPPCDDLDEAANTLGFLFQTYAATARLIDNMVHGRTDPPALLTRRYAIEDTMVGETAIKRDDAVIVLLTSPKFHFGAGRHACPGQQIAKTIADAAAPVVAGMLSSNHVS